MAETSINEAALTMALINSQAIHNPTTNVMDTTLGAFGFVVDFWVFLPLRFLWRGVGFCSPLDLFSLSKFSKSSALFPVKRSDVSLGFEGQRSKGRESQDQSKIKNHWTSSKREGAKRPLNQVEAKD